MSVNIHGKEYITVAEQIAEAHKGVKKLSINTEVLPDHGKIVVKATVTTDKGTFTGISAANPDKMIEKQSPYEVAETSAVGRALGFAGFGSVEGIATADEMKKAESEADLKPRFQASAPPARPSSYDEANENGASVSVDDFEKNHICPTHGTQMRERTGSQGKWYDHRQQFEGVWKKCSGGGWKS